MIHTCNAASFKRINTARLHVTSYVTDVGPKNLALRAL